jgi:LPS-assembly protein
LPNPHPLGRRAAIALAVAALCSPALAADGPLALQPSTALEPKPSGDAARQRPMLLQSDSVKVRPDIDAVAEGGVEFRQSGLTLQADRLRYDSPSDTAVASGKVSILRDGMRYSGTELQLQVQRFQGFFLQPEFEFERLGSGGRAQRIDFIDSERASAVHALYTSCPRDDGSRPDWLLRTDRVKLDFEANEGVAEGAVLQFLGVPILGAPVLSFPLSDDRKSGWLPPTIGLDSRSGFALAVPYYWNIAPNRDATFTPIVLTRRGLALDSEFRYLETQHHGRLRLNLLPNDRTTGTSRYAWEVDSEGWLHGAIRYSAQAQRVSDDAYWKDFPQVLGLKVPRLLGQDLMLQRGFQTALGAATAYARVQHWQVLQTGSGSDLIVAPYQRSPQLGLRLTPALGAGLRATLETEVNRFTRTPGSADATAPTGWRGHVLGQLSRPFTWPGAWVTPRLSVNAATYSFAAPGQDTQRSSRLIPTASIDAGMVLEREASLFGRAQRQTLEPRLLYVNTPYRDQSALPNFDAAERDFNAVSIYAENAFTGIDRVSDAHQLTAGFTTRLVDEATGAETLRLGVAQRFRLRDQRVVLSGEELTQRFSDVLVEGSTSVFNPWRLDVALQYNPDNQRVVRSIVGVRFQPGPFRTLSAGYRLARGLSEQMEVGWQWPLWRGTATPLGASGGCGGTLYAVGRVNYSLRDSRITDSLFGAEYDSGCWIARIVAERLSTGRAEATTRLMLQLELVGLSRIGSNPLQALKDNVPGYRLLREPRGSPFSTPEP